MKCNYTIKNFRVFNSEGKSFEFSPITILTGCNSSGKSSLVKSLLVFDSFLKQMKQGFAEDNCNPLDYTLDFSVKEAKLGRFDLVQNTKNKPIVFAYDIVSEIYPKSLHVEYSFITNEKDMRNQGILKGINIIDNAGVSILDVSNDDGKLKFHEINLAPLKDIFSLYCYYGLGMSILSEIEAYELLGVESGLNESEVADLKDNLNTIKDNLSAVPSNIKDSFKRHFKNKNFKSDIINLRNAEELNYIYHFKSPFNLPALSDCMHGLSKEEFVEYYSSHHLIAKSEGEDTKYYLNKIKEDFIASKHERFKDYFREIENKEGLVFVNPSDFSFSRKKDFISCFKKATEIRYCYFKDYLQLPGDGYELDDSMNISKVSVINDSYEDWLKSRDVTPISFRNIIDTFYEASLLTDDEFREEYNKRAHLDCYFDIPSYNIFQNYVCKLLEDILVPDFTGNIFYHSSDKATVRRLYSLNDSNDSFDELLIRYMNLVKGYRGKFHPGDFINKWIKVFNIAEKIEFKNTAEGLGFLLIVHKDADDIDGHLLADEGYGITQLLSVMISIEASIMSSQCFNETKCASRFTVAIEEPEIHLHPCFQSLLAVMYLDAVQLGIDFIIETHSEYLIRKLQSLVADKNNNLAKDDVSIYYLSNPISLKEEEQQVRRIRIKDDGRLDSPFGSGFFDESDNLVMDLLTLKANM